MITLCKSSEVSMDKDARPSPPIRLRSKMQTHANSNRNSCSSSSSSSNNNNDSDNKNSNKSEICTTDESKPRHEVVRERSFCDDGSSYFNEMESITEDTTRIHFDHIQCSGYKRPSEITLSDFDGSILSWVDSQDDHGSSVSSTLLSSDLRRSFGLASLDSLPSLFMGSADSDKPMQQPARRISHDNAAGSAIQEIGALLKKKQYSKPTTVRKLDEDSELEEFSGLEEESEQDDDSESASPITPKVRNRKKPSASQDTPLTVPKRQGSVNGDA